MTTVVVDYGWGNLQSVVQAARAAAPHGEQVLRSGSPDDVKRADRLIVPGQGAFRDTSMSLHGTALGESILEKMRAGTPLDDADRWPWLDRLGFAAGEVVASGGRVVAACSALKRGYRERLRAAIGAPTRFVLLDAGQDELLRRLTQRSGHYMPASLLDSQLATGARTSRKSSRPSSRCRQSRVRG